MHLVNASGYHESAGIIDNMKPIGPLAVKIRVDESPNVTGSRDSIREVV